MENTFNRIDLLNETKIIFAIIQISCSKPIKESENVNLHFVSLKYLPMIVSLKYLPMISEIKYLPMISEIKLIKIRTHEYLTDQEIYFIVL